MNILKPNQYKVDITPWGSLTWFASKELNNTEEMTVGKCVIKVGEENPRHVHPNCEEILYVLKGKISHSYNSEEKIMEMGDTISIPANISHNAKNIGDTEAELLITFSSAERRTIGE